MTSMIFQFFFGATFYHAINLARQTHNKPWIGMNEMFLIKGKKKKKKRRKSIRAHDEASKPFFIE